MAIDKTIKIDVEATQGIKEIDRLKKGVQDTSKGAKDSKGSFNAMESGVRGVGLAFKAMGIGIIVAGFVALKSALEKNQVFMDKVNVASAVFGDVMTKVADVVMSVVNGLGLLGKAVGKVLKGEFKEAGDLAKQSFDGVKEAVVGNNESFSDFIKNAKEGAKATVEFAKATTNMRNEVKLADAQQRQLQLTYQREAELQRQIRDDISLTFEERIAANEELARILDEQFQKEQELANKKVSLAELELSRNKTNIDLQVALIDAKTELADLDERITGQRSEQLTNLKSLEKEYQDSLKTTATVAKKAGELEIKTTKLTGQQKLDIIANTMGQIASVFGEESKAGKALAIGQTLISTYSAAAAALKEPPVGAGPIWGIPVAIGAVLSGLANVKKIKATKLPYGDSGGGDVGGGSADVPAMPSGIGGEGLIPNLEGIETAALGEPQPVQAYVVENDISDAQALQQELDIQATL